VLAALAVDAGRTVSVDALVDRVWGPEPPPNVRRTVHSYIARARRALERMPAGAGGPVRVVNAGGGYRLDIDPERVDLHRFRRLVGQARAMVAAAPRGAALREAVGLWRGDPLIGLDGSWVERVRRSWRHEWVSAVVAWAETELAVGDPGDARGVVTDLVAEFPLDESLAGVLMKLLAAGGRKAEALEHYTAIRDRLADELGIDPGPELRAVHRALLRGELDPRPRPAPPPPAQLPSDLATFTGHRPADLAALLTSAEPGPAGRRWPRVATSSTP
jgi:DNA-binding SARP family transcriptional activator